MDGVKKVGCYWVNRLSGMGIRSPFAFDHVNRILRFKGFSDPIHESEIFNNSPPDPDWDLVRFNESLESISCGYYDAIDARSPVGYLCKYTSKGIGFDSWGKLPRGGRLYGHGGFSPSMRITRVWRLAPSWVRELIDEVDGVKRVGCYWVNRVSGMGVRSPFIFDHVSRILRFKGFSDPIHIDDIQKVKKDDTDWDKVRFLESVLTEGVKINE